jgi:hypothetical protein
MRIEASDEGVLAMVEREVLGTRVREELLALMDRCDSHEWERLMSDRNRLRVEIERLVSSIAARISAETVAPQIREREQELGRVEARLRLPRQEVPDIERLRKALTLRAEKWKADLRAEPQVARMVLRKLMVGF